MNICYIIAAMPFNMKINKRPGDIIIAADAGYRHIGNEKPNIILGDFDSLGYIPEDETVIKYPCTKDYTDTLLAVKEGLKQGYKKFVILGGIGGKLEHTVANLQTLAYIKNHGADGCFTGNGESAVLLHNESKTITSVTGTSLSVFSFSEIAEGVTLTGLSYPLFNAELYSFFPIGVSNEFTSTTATVSVHHGKLLVIWSENADINEFSRENI